ncbi:uncharacterized protein A1O5_11486 [Cladophialophora psammophila CBS 110553]|uniref:CobW/HypB/UreG nucleotide-binding domain-containing protein n=1 Tax=Cladophialophora psammophila CBS 110553 TaxID=1182543 RepID=W9W5R7_9EURO|nr:uncharacterized protein A1O5_11486 [Cladophialophora psammophila CBS 110553]EXJ63437.1 hypothetical protein A1O5_11486 [Cladophialophora psammophila CBS 110553]
MAVMTRQRARSSRGLAERGPIPVTLVSGFLGSGKTTLLKHIRTSGQHSLQVAVIVNDMAALNIDASLIKRHMASRTQERLIQMENGCICCTLRGDLLEELANLARNGECEYVLIESTGISEPMADLDGLQNVAKLDALVTIVDAFNFLDNFATTEFITDRWGKEGVDPEDERTITDLMVDQMSVYCLKTQVRLSSYDITNQSVTNSEFANTIILNKADSVDKATKSRIRAVIHQLNPAAKVLESNYSKVDAREVIATKTFSFEKAATNIFIEADFAEPWGDRRQEIVFIGEKLHTAGLKAEFDQCLLTDAEMQKWEKIMKSSEDKQVINDKSAVVFEGDIIQQYQDVLPGIYN